MVQEYFGNPEIFIEAREVLCCAKFIDMVSNTVLRTVAMSLQYFQVINFG